MRKKLLNIGVWGARGIPSTYSGYETFLTAFLPELSGRGHDVTMYCRKNQVPNQREYRGVRLVHLPAPTSKQLGTLAHGLVAAFRARLARHDVVLVVNVANALYSLFVRASGQRTVLNTDGQEWLRGKWGPAARTFFKTSARIARFGSAALISDCVAMRDLYLSEFAAESSVIPYPWTGLDNLPEPEAVLTPLGLIPDEYYLAAGRLNPENNIHEIARAYAGLGLKRPLVLLGAANYDSPVERELHQLARSVPEIRLVGHVSDRVAFATLLREARAYIHGHSVGGLNPSLVEAMGCGALILALDTVFNREGLGPAGMLFRDFKNDLPRQLQLIDRGQHPSGLRRQARDRVASVFRMDDVLLAHEQLFQVVANAGVWTTSAISTKWSPAIHQASHR